MSKSYLSLLDDRRFVLNTYCILIWMHGNVCVKSMWPVPVLATHGRSHIDYLVLHLCLNVAGGWWAVISRSSTPDQRELFRKESGRVIERFLMNDVTMASLPNKDKLRGEYQLEPNNRKAFCPVYDQMCVGSAIRQQHTAMYSLCLLITFKLLC